MTDSDDLAPLSRRGVLAVVAAAGSSGCVQQVRSLVNRRSLEPVSMKIKTVPADDDEMAIEIARRLETHMSAVGIDTSIEIQAQETFLRDILLNNDFDVYISRFPPRYDPDFLRPMLHSSFDAEPGWQNPFGLSDLELDEMLLEQRRAEDGARQNIVEDIAVSIAETQPFSVVCFPEEMTVFKTDRFENWPEDGQFSPLTFLSLDRVDGAAETDESTGFTIAYTDARLTRNLNPIAVEYRRQGLITGLLYDSLARRDGQTFRPWLVRDVEWDETDAGTIATATLREGVTWHDDRPLTSSDIAFTYRFFDDTTLGEGDTSVPAPRFRGRTSLVESVTTPDDRTVRLTFGETSRPVASRALTVPILPAHIWESKTGSADLGGLNLSRAITEALVWPNAEPVGSGPLAFDSRTPDEQLRLVRFDDHFLGTDPPQWIDGMPPYDGLDVRIAPSEKAAVALVADGNADVTGTPIRPAIRETVAEVDAVETRVGTSQSFYHVGFNADRAPLGNVRFRRLLSRLLDPSAVVDSIFDGDARPAATPLAGTVWMPAALRWDDDDPVVPFLGTDGELNVSAAREAFREAGFQYDEDRLVR